MPPTIRVWFVANGTEEKVPAGQEVQEVLPAVE
jgi:hypothetical protein